MVSVPARWVAGEDVADWGGLLSAALPRFLFVAEAATWVSTVAASAAVAGVLAGVVATPVAGVSAAFAGLLRRDGAIWVPKKALLLVSSSACKTKPLKT